MNRSPSDCHKPLPPFELHKYESIETLINIVVDKSETCRRVVEGKFHVLYFKNYFEEIGAKTVIVENDYIDRDFLEDFSEYYVTCFRHYKKKCTRLHFFSTEFESVQFLNVLRGKNKDILDQIRKSYLGFIIIKPLPETIFGKTCIKVYDQQERRYYLGLTDYNVNLFGINLNVNSLAFQEQDRVLSACATSALWSIFHVTGKVYQHQIYSPSAITKLAALQAPSDKRFFPNVNGLTVNQIAGAIREAGLEPDNITPSELFTFKGTIYAYLRSHIPVLLVIKLVKLKDGKITPIGYHAVAVTGYSQGLDSCYKVNPEEPILVASKIDKVYVHDDQVGPFARMSIEEQQSSLKVDNVTYHYVLSTSWGNDPNIKAIPLTILVPAYKKVRISFKSVIDTLRSIDFIVSEINKIKKIFTNDLVWDVYLTTVNEIKADYFSNDKFINKQLSDVLLFKMPKFIWRATAYNGENIELDFLFDATDIEQASFLNLAIDHGGILFSLLKSISGIESILTNREATHAKRVFDWFSQPR